MTKFAKKGPYILTLTLNGVSIHLIEYNNSGVARDLIEARKISVSENRN